MANTDLKLLGKWSSPYVIRVKIALKLKSLEYENLEEHETFNPKSDLLLQSNPVYAKVPVLIHHGKPICESMVIIEYIDEAWSTGPSILPSDAYDRALARFWVAYIDDKWFPTIETIVTVDDEERKPYYELLDEVLKNLEDAFGKLSKGKPFFGGDRIGYLDIAFGCFLGWLSAIEQEYGRKVLVESKFPGLAKWAERFVTDPSVEGIIPETDRVAKLSRAFRIKWRAELGKK